MMVEKEDLGLSLSLNFPAAVEKNRYCNTSSSHLNLMPPLVSSSLRLSLLRGTRDSVNSFTSSSSSQDRNNATAFGVETKSFLKGIYVNQMPRLVTKVVEEAGVSSPNNTISSISGKRSDRDLAVEHHETDRASSRGISDEEDGDNSRKKLRLSKDQSAVLEENFKEHNTLNPKQKQALANKLHLRPRQVEVWFQNRRARTKLKQTEVDCELMKKWCENLTEENMRLEKELQELRALKVPTKLSVLTMCASCEHRKFPYNPRAGYEGQ